jgi:hypothetical protein
MSHLYFDILVEAVLPWILEMGENLSFLQEYVVVSNRIWSISINGGP